MPIDLISASRATRSRVTRPAATTCSGDRPRALRALASPPHSMSNCRRSTSPAPVATCTGIQTAGGRDRSSSSVEQPLSRPAPLIDNGGQQRCHRDLRGPAWKELAQAGDRLATRERREGFRSIATPAAERRSISSMSSSAAACTSFITCGSWEVLLGSELSIFVNCPAKPARSDTTFGPPP